VSGRRPACGNEIRPEAAILTNALGKQIVRATLDERATALRGVTLTAITERADRLALLAERAVSELPPVVFGCRSRRRVLPVHQRIAAAMMRSSSTDAAPWGRVSRSSIGVRERRLI
jgi:hypothetical protein